MTAKGKEYVAVTEIKHGKVLDDGSVMNVVYAPEELIDTSDFTADELKALLEAGSVGVREAPAPPEPPKEEARKTTPAKKTASSSSTSSSASSDK